MTRPGACKPDGHFDRIRELLKCPYGYGMMEHLTNKVELYCDQIQ